MNEEITSHSHSLYHSDIKPFLFCFLKATMEIVPSAGCTPKFCDVFVPHKSLY